MKRGGLGTGVYGRIFVSEPDGVSAGPVRCGVWGLESIGLKELECEEANKSEAAGDDVSEPGS